MDAVTRVGGRLYAWAHAMTPPEVAAATARFPGLGVVLYPANYAAAPGLAVPPIAYVNNVRDARAAALTPDAWGFAILGDERNVTGLSGKREEPDVYMARMEPARQMLVEAGVRTSSAGLAMLGGLRGRFDHEYTGALAGWTAQAGVNLNPLQYRAMVRGIRQHASTQFFVTLIPQRMAWRPHNTVVSGFMQQYLACPPVWRQYVTLLQEPQVAGVGVWCLRETTNNDGSAQTHHGLLDRRGRVTRVGRGVLRALVP